MYRASATWEQEFRFAGKGNGGVAVAVDGDGKAANSPMELVLVALCGCTGYDVVSILKKKRRRQVVGRKILLGERDAEQDCPHHL
jgi:uncharacterized OsmC-like protein